MFTRKQIFSLLIPIIAEQFFGILVGMADTMMVSSAGEAAVSGVSLVDSINLIVFSLLSSFSTGGAIICSQYIGAKNLDKAKKSASQLCMAAFVVGTFFTIVCIIFAKPLLNLIYGAVEKDVISKVAIGAHEDRTL